MKIRIKLASRTRTTRSWKFRTENAPSAKVYRTLVIINKVRRAPGDVSTKTFKLYSNWEIFTSPEVKEKEARGFWWKINERDVAHNFLFKATKTESEILRIT